MAELKEKLKSKKNSVGIMTVNSVLDVPVFKQENNYYCGPATVKQVLHFLNGSSLSQKTYASELGTTTSGTNMVNIPDVLNEHRQNDGPSYSYREFDEFKNWYPHVALDIMNERPVIIDITSTKDNWLYATSGHFMCISGYDDSTSTKYAWVTDPHPKHYGTYKYKAEEVYTVNRAHWRHAMIW